MSEMLLLATDVVLITFLAAVWRSKKKLQTHLVQLGVDMPVLIQEYETEKRRAKEYFAKIEEVLRERDTWRNLYNDQASGHDNAQALMMQTISQLALLYERDTGKRPRLDPIIEAVRGDWVGNHGPVAREKLASSGPTVFEALADQKKERADGRPTENEPSAAS